MDIGDDARGYLYINSEFVIKGSVSMINVFGDR